MPHGYPRYSMPMPQQVAAQAMQNPGSAVTAWGEPEELGDRHEISTLLQWASVGRVEGLHPERPAATLWKAVKALEKTREALEEAGWESCIDTMVAEWSVDGLGVLLAGSTQD